MLGGMGHHHVNKKLYGSLDPAKPAALLYEDRRNEDWIDEDWIDEASDTSWLDDLDALDGEAFPVALSAATGSRRLVASEWIVVDKDQDLATDDDRPSLFGVPFNGPMRGHEPGMPITTTCTHGSGRRTPAACSPAGTPR